MQTLALSYASWKTVTPSDTTLLSFRGIYVGGTGDVAISPDGTTASITLKAVPTGTLLPFTADQGRILATGTTATNLVALA